MNTVDRRVQAAMLLRSLAVQGSWNYRTLIGAGLGFALLPALRTIYGDDPAALNDAVRRHSGLFNSHPYLAPVALGALAVLEAAGEDPALIDRFKTALRGSLGSLGDALVWVAWRSTCALLAIAMFVIGAPWWLVLAGFLVVYNAGHLALRVWALRLGLRDGKNVGQRLRGSPVRELGGRVAAVGVFAAGFALPFVAAGDWIGVGVPGVVMVLAAGAAAVGMALGARIRLPAIAVLLSVALLGWFFGGIE